MWLVLIFLQLSVFDYLLGDKTLRYAFRYVVQQLLLLCFSYHSLLTV